jgi:hypothetical protein
LEAVPRDSNAHCCISFLTGLISRYNRHNKPRRAGDAANGDRVTSWCRTGLTTCHRTNEQTDELPATTNRGKRTMGRRRNQKLGQFEPLESRLLMTCAPVTGPVGGVNFYQFCWQNEELPADVNQDGEVAPLDALIVINELSNRELSHVETGELPPDGLFQTNAAGSWNGLAPTRHRVDVDGDQFVSPADALAVVNALETVTVLDLNGMTKNRFGAPVHLEWDADQLELIPKDARFTEGAFDTLEGVLITFPTDASIELSLSAEIGGTNISLHHRPGELELTGTDSLENYRRVLDSVKMHASGAGERDAESFKVLLEINNGAQSSRTHIHVQIDDTNHQIVGMPLAAASEWAEPQFDSIRIIRPGDLITMDLRPNRFNILVDEFDIVTDVAFY